MAMDAINSTKSKAFFKSLERRDILSNAKAVDIYHKIEYNIISL